MATNRHSLFLLMVIFLVLSLAAVFYLVKVRFSGSELFWYGAIAGLLSCLALISLILTIYIGYKLAHKT
jgi:hypothetical protein